MNDRSAADGKSAPGAGASALSVLYWVSEQAVRLWNAVRDIWLRSIQVRVITVTLTLSLVVVSLLGATLLRQVTDGLLQAQADAAVAEASASIDSVQRTLDAAKDDEKGSLDQLLVQIVQDQSNRGTRPGADPLYEVVLLSSDEATTTELASRNIQADSVPSDLRTKVQEEPLVFWTYTSILYPSGHAKAPSEAGLIVGGQITAPDTARYELYYLYPLTEQQATIDLVWAAVATAGLLLVLLLVALSWLVTRQVVTPVRLAARIAERFSAGDFSERMSVRGRDDLARLATSFNQMAASLQLKIGQLQELSRIQQQFVSDVSHELRTPLTTVRMAADVLYESRKNFDPVVERSVELLQNQLDRFEALLTDLLEISRFDAGAAILEAEPHDVRDLVHSVTDAAAPLAAAMGTRLVLDLPQQPCVATIDKRRVERILRNLVSNAIEHGEGEDVTVRVAADEQAVAIAVRDHGVGLKPGETSLVFHRFWRADPARARTIGGTGLGLSIALEDARLHGGWLQAWGEPGAGSQFRLTLPRHVGTDLTASPLSLIPDDPGDGDDHARLPGGPYRRIAPPPSNTKGVQARG